MVALLTPARSATASMLAASSPCVRRRSVAASRIALCARSLRGLPRRRGVDGAVIAVMNRICPPKNETRSSLRLGRSRVQPRTKAPLTPGSQAQIPRYVGAAVERVLAARGEPERLMRLFHRSAVPLFLFDDDRRYMEANS